MWTWWISWKWIFALFFDLSRSLQDGLFWKRYFSKYLYSCFDDSKVKRRCSQQIPCKQKKRWGIWDLSILWNFVLIIFKLNSCDLLLLYLYMIHYSYSQLLFVSSCLVSVQHMCLSPLFSGFFNSWFLLKCIIWRWNLFNIFHKNNYICFS